MNNQAFVITYVASLQAIVNTCNLDMLEAQDLQIKAFDVFLARWCYPMLLYWNGIGIQLTGKEIFLQFLASPNRVA